MPNLKAAIVPVTAFQQNCALIWDDGSKRATIVDPGGDVERILGAVDQLAIRPERILLTHGHLDHAGGAAALRERLTERTGQPIPIEGPDERDRFLLDGLERQAAKFGLPGVRDVLPDRWLREGDTIDVAGHRLRCPALPRPHARATWCS